jgi:hypothetical protein
LGVAEGSKAHRLYDPDLKRVAVSRDVVFEEAKGWMWNGDEKSDHVEFQIENEFVENTNG